MKINNTSDLDFTDYLPLDGNDSSVSVLTINAFLNNLQERLDRLLRAPEYYDVIKIQSVVDSSNKEDFPVLKNNLIPNTALIINANEIFDSENNNNVIKRGSLIVKDAFGETHVVDPLLGNGFYYPYKVDNNTLYYSYSAEKSPALSDEKQLTSSGATSDKTYYSYSFTPPVAQATSYYSYAGTTLPSTLPVVYTSLKEPIIPLIKFFYKKDNVYEEVSLTDDYYKITLSDSNWSFSSNLPAIANWVVIK